MAQNDKHNSSKECVCGVGNDGKFGLKLKKKQHKCDPMEIISSFLSFLAQNMLK